MGIDVRMIRHDGGACKFVRESLRAGVFSDFDLNATSNVSA